MPVATVTSKGQVTIPKEIRDRLGVRPGSRIDFVETETGEIVVRVKKASIKALYGFLPYDGPAATVEQMNEAVARSVAAANR